MPVCGFNKKMLEGLTAFSEGLVEHGLQYRCEKNRETIEQGIKRDIYDMARLLTELKRIEDKWKLNNYLNLMLKADANLLINLKVTL